MFDSLKDKLGSFRDEAEEVAEEKAEELDEDDLEELDEDELEALEDEAADASTDPDAENADPDSAAAAEESDLDVDPDSAAAVDEGETAAADAESPETATAAGTVPREDEDAPTSDGAEPDTDADGSDAAEPDADAESAAEDADPENADTEDAADEKESSGGLLSKANPFSGGSSAGAEETDAGDATSGEAETAESATDPTEPDAGEPEADAADAETTANPVEGETAEGAGDAAGGGDDVESEDEDSTGFAARAKAVATGQFVIEEADLEDPLWELEMALLESDVEMSVAKEVLGNIEDQLVGQTRRFTESTGAVVEEALGEAILDVIGVGQFDFDQRAGEADKPLVVIFTGVNGVGKTTSIAKLSQYLEERGYSSVMANGDTYRAGANEQIREHADNLDRKLITHEQGGDPAAVIYDAVEYAEANDVDVVLGDTAGRLHTNEDLMDQLAKIERVVGPDMTLFVDEAVAGQDAVNRAKQFNEAAEIDGAVLTKADADSQGGAAISIAHVTGKPILFLGVGQGYDDIEPFDPDEMVGRLLGDDE